MENKNGMNSMNNMNNSMGGSNVNSQQSTSRKKGFQQKEPERPECEVQFPERGNQRVQPVLRLHPQPLI